MNNSTSLKSLDFLMVEEIDDNSAETISGGFIHPVPFLPVPLLLPIMEFDQDFKKDSYDSKKHMYNKHKKKDMYNKHK